jgi:hypothetical protein
MAVKFTELFAKGSSTPPEARLVGQESTGDLIYVTIISNEKGAVTRLSAFNTERKTDKALYQLSGRHNIVHASLNSTETLLSFTSVSKDERETSSRPDAPPMYETCLVVLQPRGQVRLVICLVSS